MTRTRKMFVAIFASLILVCTALFTLTACFSKELTGLEITTAPTKVEYVAGETFDPTGMVVSAVYGEQKEEVTEYTYDLTEPLKTSDKKVTVSYTEGEVTVKATVSITVENEIVSLTIKTAPTKVSYMVGETFNPAGMVLTATYENGDTKDITVEGSSATYKTEPLTKDDTTIVVTYLGKTVEQTIEFAKGVFIEAEDGLIVSETVDINSDSTQASGGKYVGDMMAGDTISFMFNSDKAGKGDIEFRLASLYLKEDSNWTPIWMGDCQFNKICKFSVNGVEYAISDSVVLPGGGQSGGTPDATLWFNWQQVLFENIDFVAGINTIVLEFIPHDYTDTSQSSFSGTFTANVDSLIVTSAECEVEPATVSVDEYTATKAYLELVENAVYYVVEGTAKWTGYTEDQIAENLNAAIEFDFQGNLAVDGENIRVLNTAADRIVTVTQTAEGEGTFKMMVNVTDLDITSEGIGKYSTHFGAGLPSFDFLETSAVLSGADNAVVIGAATYTIVYDPMKSANNNPEIAGSENSTARREGYYGTVGLLIENTNPTSLDFEPTAADIGEVDGKAYLYITGTYTAVNYTEDEIKAIIAASYFDLQNVDSHSKAVGNGWQSTKFTSTAADVTLGTTTVEGATVYTYKVSFDVSNLAASAYVSHYNPGGTSATDFKPGIDVNKEITVGTKKYTLVIVAEDVGDNAELFWNCPGLIIEDSAAAVNTINTAMTLVKEGEKVFVVVNGTYANMTEAEVKAAYAFDAEVGAGANTGSKTQFTEENGTLTWSFDATNGTFTVKIDVTGLAAEGPFWMHYAAGKDLTCTADANSAITIGNKTYVLRNYVFSWGNRDLLCIDPVAAEEGGDAEEIAKYAVTFTGVTLKVEGEKAYYVVTGTAGSAYVGENAEVLKIAADFQHNSNVDGKGWNRDLIYADTNIPTGDVNASTVYLPAVVATVNADGTFEAKFDVTGLAAGCYTVHAGVDGTMSDYKHGGNDVTPVTLGNNTYSIKCDGATWNISALLITETVVEEGGEAAE